MFCHLSTKLPCRVPTAKSQAGPERRLRWLAKGDQGHSCRCCNPTSSCQFHPICFHQKRKTGASYSLYFPPVLGSVNCTKTIDSTEKKPNPLVQREVKKQPLLQGVPALLIRKKHSRGNEHLHFSRGPPRYRNLGPSRHIFS